MSKWKSISGHFVTLNEISNFLQQRDCSLQVTAVGAFGCLDQEISSAEMTTCGVNAIYFTLRTTRTGNKVSVQHIHVNNPERYPEALMETHVSITDLQSTDPDFEAGLVAVFESWRKVLKGKATSATIHVMPSRRRYPCKVSSEALERFRRGTSPASWTGPRRRNTELVEVLKVGEEEFTFC